MYLLVPGWSENSTDYWIDIAGDIYDWSGGLDNAGRGFMAGYITSQPSDSRCGFLDSALLLNAEETTSYIVSKALRPIVVIDLNVVDFDHPVASNGVTTYNLK